MGLFSARRPVRVRPVRRAQLSLEVLERREQPSDFFVPQPYAQDPNAPIYGPPEESYAANEAPAVQDFNVQSLGYGVFILSGHVADEQPGGLTVRFGGGIEGMDGVTVTTDANGNFSVTVTVPAGEFGTVTATVVDSQGQTSTSVSRLVEVNE